MKKVKTRQLQETSWLAQIIQDQMDVEFSRHEGSNKWHCLHTLKIIVNEADNSNNEKIYHAHCNNKHQIIICEIPSLIEYGTDFNMYGMQRKLRGLAERYKDDNGMYIVSVSTTHDLNSATILDVDELMFQIGQDQ